MALDVQAACGMVVRPDIRPKTIQIKCGIHTGPVVTGNIEPGWEIHSALKSEKAVMGSHLHWVKSIVFGFFKQSDGSMKGT